MWQVCQICQMSGRSLWRKTLTGQESNYESQHKGENEGEDENTNNDLFAIETGFHSQTPPSAHVDLLFSKMIPSIHHQRSGQDNAGLSSKS